MLRVHIHIGKGTASSPNHQTIRTVRVVALTHDSEEALLAPVIASGVPDDPVVTVVFISSVAHYRDVVVGFVAVGGAVDYSSSVV